MVYDEEDRRRVFPTRTGPTQGGAAERKMLDAVDGAQGIRTRVRDNGDGSMTLLRTRAGHPEFVTTGTQAPGVACLRGPFEELDHSKRRWHPAIADLVSSDGLFTIPRAPLRKIAVVAGEIDPKKPVEINLASSAVAGQSVSPTVGALQLVEPEYAERLWHPRQMGRIAELGLYFAMDRLRALVLNCPKLDGKRRFTWWFSKDGDPAFSGALPVCMNRDAQETGLATRVLHGLSQIKKFVLRVKDRAGAVITAAPGGFLGGFDSPTVGDSPEFPVVLSDTDLVLNDLSRSLSCGQPWHGWMVAAGILTTADLVNFPAGRLVSPSGYAAPTEDPREGNTHYVALPGLPDVSDLVPDGFAYSGMQYFKDAIFFGATKRYSPIADALLGYRRWLHYNETTKAIHVLRMDVVGSVTWSSATVRFFDDGEWTIRGILGTPRELATIPIACPIDLTPILTASGPSYELQGHVSTQLLDFGGGDTIHFPLNQSPTGNRVLVQHLFRRKLVSGSGRTASNAPFVSSVTEVTFSDDLLTIMADQVWQLSGDFVADDPNAMYRDEEYYHDIAEKWVAIPTFGGEGYFSDMASAIAALTVTNSATAQTFNIHASWNTYRRGPIAIDAPADHEILHLVNADYTTAGALSLLEVRVTWAHDAPAYDDSLYQEGFSPPNTPAWSAAIPLWGQLEISAGTGSPPRAYTVTQTASDLTGYVQNTWVSPYPGDVAIETVSPSHVLSVQDNVTPYGFDFIRFGLETAYLWRRYTNNLTVFQAADAADWRFIATEADETAVSLGFSPGSSPVGYACYNPRTGEIRWSPTPISCV